MTYVDKIILKFGGVRPLARQLGLPPTTVSSWKERGSIPDSKKAIVLEGAISAGFSLSPSDFFPHPPKSPEGAA